MNTSRTVVSCIKVMSTVLVGCANTTAPPADAGVAPSHAAGSSAPAAANGVAAPSLPGLPSVLLPPSGQPGIPTCLPGSAAQAEGCPCRANELAACWTGAAADRNRGACHDGMQKCNGNADAEFGVWGPCEGQELRCGDPGTSECGCVPGATIQCDEDCSVSIFCSLSATKTCQPDGTWGACHEEPGRTSTTVLLGDGGIEGLLDGGLLSPDGGLTGLVSIPASVLPLLGDAGQLLGDAGAAVNTLIANGPCRTTFHGCESLLGQKEIFVGDCSKSFTCQHAPQ